MKPESDPDPESPFDADERPWEAPTPETDAKPAPSGSTPAPIVTRSQLGTRNPSLPLPGVVAAYAIPKITRAVAGELDRSARVVTKADTVRPSIVDDEEEDTTVEPLEAASRIAAGWPDVASPPVPARAVASPGAASARPFSLRRARLSAALAAMFIAGLIAGGLFLPDLKRWLLPPADPLTHGSPPTVTAPVLPAGASAASIQALPPQAAAPTGPHPIAAPPATVRTAGEAAPQTTKGRPKKVLKLRGLTLTGSSD